MQFKVGDIVQLKSGGPKMTIVSPEVDMAGRYRTSWFAGSKNETGYFPPEALEVAEEKKIK